MGGGDENRIRLINPPGSTSNRAEQTGTKRRARENLFNWPGPNPLPQSHNQKSFVWSEDAIKSSSLNTAFIGRSAGGGPEEAGVPCDDGPQGDF